MKNVNHKMGATEWLLLLILSVLWGGSFFFVGVAVKTLPPFTIVALRVGLAAIALNIVVRATGLRMPTDRRLWSAFFGMGLLNNMIPFCLIVWGQTHIASGIASIFNATTPICTVIVAHAFTKDKKITGGRLVGIIVGFAGVSAIIGLDSLNTLGTIRPHLPTSFISAFCRPGCSSRLPKRENIEFYLTPSEAKQSGYRPCKRCAPE